MSPPGNLDVLPHHWGKRAGHCGVIWETNTTSLLDELLMPKSMRRTFKKYLDWDAELEDRESPYWLQLLGGGSSESHHKQQVENLTKLNSQEAALEQWRMI